MAMTRCRHGLDSVACALCAPAPKPAFGNLASLFDDPANFARKQHSWTVGDDLVALYLFRFGDGSIGTSETLGKRLGMGPASLRMRVGNFRALAGSGGLRHPARQTAEVYRRYGKLPEPELRALVREYLTPTGSAP